MAAGLVIRQWAIIALGRFFTVDIRVHSDQTVIDVRVHSDQTVIDTGPYRWVRHPSYTGMITFFLGVGLGRSAK
jgi:protein-S-isoprenylcysteine O-methyltransferase